MLKNKTLWLCVVAIFVGGNWADARAIGNEMWYVDRNNISVCRNRNLSIYFKIKEKDRRGRII